MKLQRKGALPLLLICLTASAGVGAQTPQRTLREAIDRALGQNPEAAGAHAGQAEASAAVRQARTQLLPQLSFTEDMSRGNDPVHAFGTRLRQRQFTQADFALSALNSPAPIGNFSTRFSGSWMAFDSLRTQREIARAGMFAKSAESSSKAVDQKIVFDVVRAYQAVLFAEREMEVARHEQETAAALVASVEDRVKAGLAVESDRMSALVNQAARRQELIGAEGDRDLAWAELRMATGAPDLQATPLKPLEAHTFPEQPVEEAIAAALKARPDLAALGHAQEAQGLAVSAAKSSFGPRVSAYGNWEEDLASIGGAGGNNWVAGVQVGIDILPLGKRSELARQTAAKQRIDAQAASYQQQIRLQVSQAGIHRRTAVLSVETARAAMDQAAESLRIVKNRYEAGLGTITDLLRAEDAERQSQTNYWHAVYGNTLAYTEMLFATGALTPDRAEELQ